MPEISAQLSTALADRYRLERHLGEGGMATVYLAHDPKHDRKVAVKVLKPELAAVIGAERFLNEIKVTANLQHPNILALYDSGEADSFLYYVMPFIEGESLRDRLDRETQLSVDDATAITESVAAALGYAHRQGVVHRDIKPANILLHEGQALVADFGIALALSHAAGSRLTETGLSVGTPHYMSPEQAMGDRELDGRSDVYSLGCVAYEMLAGEPPHTGPSAQAIVAKIVTDVPQPVTDARPATPESFAAAIEKALEKLPADRFATADDFSTALRSATPVTRSRTATRTTTRARPYAFAIAALAMAATFFIGRSTGAPSAGADGSNVARFTIPTPEGSIPGNTVNGYVAISRDGQRVSYALGLAATNSIFVRHLSSLHSTPVAGTIEAGSQVFSPDGQSLAYQVVGGDVFLTRLDGGTPERIASNGLWDLSWEPDGSILMGAWLQAGGIVGAPRTSSSNSTGVLRLSPGGEPEYLTAIDSAAGEAGHYFPQLLPGGRHLLVALEHNPYIGGVDVAAIDLETSARTVLIGGAARAKYVPSGHLVWAEGDGRLRASAFDVDALALTGAIITIAEDVSGAALGGYPQFDVSDRGDIVYLPATPRELVKVDRVGRIEQLTDLDRLFHSPRVAPDGRRIALDITDQDGRFLWVLDAVDGTLQKVTFEGNANDPVWTPDGRYISFGLSFNNAKRGVYRVLPDGSAAPELILQDDEIDMTPGTWFPEGDSLIVIGVTSAGWSLTVVDADDGGNAELANTRPQHAWPAISPDGRWLAYTSDDGGIPEVYVRPLDGDGRTLVSRDGGAEPVWHPSGRELFYRHARGTHEVLVAARFEPGAPPRITERAELFRMSDLEVGSPHANYDIFPDGEHFVGLRIEGGTEIVYVQNWTALFEEQ